jgi:hypothetical protein
MHVFRMPTRPHSLRIRSRSAVPQELGTVRDARSLGVARCIEADSEALKNGYYAFQPDDGIRWHADAASSRRHAVLRRGTVLQVA